MLMKIAFINLIFVYFVLNQFYFSIDSVEDWYAYCDEAEATTTKFFKAGCSEPTTELAHRCCYNIAYPDKKLPESQKYDPCERNSSSKMTLASVPIQFLIILVVSAEKAMREKPIIDAHLRGCVENQLIKLGDCCFGHYSFNRPPYTAAQLNANFCPCIKKAFPHKYQGCEANIYNTFSC
uniref:Uncharacterized protein n=1 Tax=Meloidogyne javanica TaxID=6303 RepID=A0A915MZ47_MELJA